MRCSERCAESSRSSAPRQRALLIWLVDPDRPGHDRRLLGGDGHPRGRGADDGALAALRRLDEVGGAADLGRRLPDRLPAGARSSPAGCCSPGSRRRTGSSEHITVVVGAALSIDGLVDDLRTYLGVLAFGLGLVFGFTFDTTGPQPASRLAARRLRGAGAARGARRDVCRACRGAGTRAARGGAAELPLGSGIARTPAEGDTEREMSVLAEASNRRGTELLLAHCAVVSRPSAEERLSAELGGDFSKRLVRGARRRQRARLPARLVLAVQPDVQEDPAGGDRGDEERRRLRDADRRA